MSWVPTQAGEQVIRVPPKIEGNARRGKQISRMPTNRLSPADVPPEDDLDVEQSIPPASPHRAGHYSGLHPEDQPYQSSIMPVQHSPVRESITRRPGQQEPARIILPTVGEASPKPVLDAQAVTVSERKVQSPPLVSQRSKAGMRGRFVPVVLTISFVFLLVASSILAFIFISKMPVYNPHLNANPNQVRGNDTLTLAGSGFGGNDLITFTNDDRTSIQDGSGKPLQAHADGSGGFAVSIVVPSNWPAGQHSLHANDAAHALGASALITVLPLSSAPPLLQLANAHLEFGADAPGIVSSKDITLINAGGGQVAWQASSDEPWLTIAPINGVFAGRAIAAVTINRGTLAPLSYSGHVVFKQEDSNAKSLTLTVTMAVKGASAGLVVSAPSLTYSGTTTQNPSNQTITLQNGENQPLDWNSAVTTGDGVAWLSISPASGHLEANASETITVNVKSQQLAVGTYQGTINLKGHTAPQVTVALSVAAPGNLLVSPPSLNFTSIGQNPADQITTLQNTGGQPLDWSVSAATDGVNWLSATPSSGSLDGNATTNVTVNVNVGTLKPHAYQGMLTFSYGSLTRQVAISLTVSVPPVAAISLTTSTLDFTTIKGTNPGSQTFTCTNTGNAVLNWVITEDQNGVTFASVSSTSGSLAPGKSAVITVTPAVAQANAGTLTTNIAVSDSDAGTTVAVQKVGVTITVKDQAMINLSLNTMTFKNTSTITVASTMLVVSNTGSAPLNWDAQVSPSSATWLSAPVTSGTIAPGDNAVIDVGCNSSGLSVGTYTATFVVSDSDPGTSVISQTVTVTLMVS